MAHIWHLYIVVIAVILSVDGAVVNIIFHLPQPLSPSPQNPLNQNQLANSPTIISLLTVLLFAMWQKGLS